MTKQLYCILGDKIVLLDGFETTTLLRGTWTFCKNILDIRNRPMPGVNRNNKELINQYQQKDENI